MPMRWGTAWWPVGPTHLRMDWAWVFAGSTLVVVLGVALGQALLPREVRRTDINTSLLDGFVRWDATYYRDIATRGYERRPGQAPVHFPPAYPLMARGIRAVIGGTIERSMVLTSHACLLVALALLGGYTDRRHGVIHPTARTAALVIAGFFPAGIFLHMGYSESFFLLICIGVLYLIQVGSSPIWIACIAAIGLTTRFVGLVFVLPVLMYAWHYGRGGWRSAGWVAICLPLTFAGLAGLMSFMDAAFDDPILFARGRDDLWRMREPLPLGEKLVTLLALGPVWGVFDPASPLHWGHYGNSSAEALFSVYPANPVAFLLALGLTGWGLWTRLLTRYELAMIAGLLAMPYWVGGYDMNMVSMARYVSVVAPLYSVGGVLLSRCGPVGIAGFAGCGATLMVVYSARFAQGHWII